MQVSIEEISSLRRKMQVQVPAEKIESEIEKRLNSMKSRVKIDGFRPGKVPLAIVRQRFGRQVHQEVISDTIQSCYRDAIVQEKLRPAGGPEIEPQQIGDKQDLKFNAIFDVYPEIELCDFSDLEVEAPQVQVEEKDIEATLQRLQKQRIQWQVTAEKSTQGSRITIDFIGKVDGQEFEGGKAQDYAMVIGNGQMVPGFEEALIGLGAGESKQIEIRFPEDYSNQVLAGKPATFDVCVKKIEQGLLPEINDEFSRQLGLEEGTVEALKREIRTNLEGEVAQRVQSAMKKSIMDALVENNSFELPESLVQQETRAVKSQALSSMNIQDDSQLPDDMFAEEAKRRVKLGLLIGEIVMREKMQLDKDRLQQYIQHQAAQYADPQQVLQYYQNNPQARANLEGLVMEDQVTDWVMQQVKQKTKPMSFEELINPEKA